MVKKMNAELLIFIGSALPLLWGVSHLFPTKNVVQDFGDISADNKNIIAMEWITEGVALIFIRLRHSSLQLVAGMNGEMNHGEAR